MNPDLGQTAILLGLALALLAWVLSPGIQRWRAERRLRKMAFLDVARGEHLERLAETMGVRRFVEDDASLRERALEVIRDVGRMPYRTPRGPKCPTCGARKDHLA